GWVMRALQEAPEESIAWLWKAALAGTPDEALAAARQAASLAPDDPICQEALARLEEQVPPASPTAVRTRKPVSQSIADAFVRLRATIPRLMTPANRSNWLSLVALLAAMMMIAAALLVGADLLAGSWLPRAVAAELPAGQPVRDVETVLLRRADELWQLEQRDMALTLLGEAYRLAPDDPEIARLLALRHAAQADLYLRAGEPDLARSHLKTAYGLQPDDSTIAANYHTLGTYIQGRDAYQRGELDKAIEYLTPLVSNDPGYLDARALLQGAHVRKREAERATQDGAWQILARANRAEPGKAARTALVPPTPFNLPGQQQLPPMLPTLGAMGNKHIVVSINAQRMYVYENDQLIWDWIASTGEYARPTVPGKYRIQSKIPRARSNVWSLWMPYWMGIYWAGSVENGIHGQVEFDSGGRLWEGLLGTQVTFGCVMVSDENAAILFDWAEIGTPVSIHWDWDPSWLPDANGDRRQ
ncbi:MAG TPA: L,D-transpeptidase family protein, partial [Ardenticatenaceae bacterium]|nr:L,D-transpeptidase family protein [Ardenticatenaceae bacterium]